jgi:ATP-dependent Clp protease ATP-binding subunit ClpC
MFERYTEKARRVIFFARYEASQVGSQAIDAEHILLGLLREDKQLTQRFFQTPRDAVESIRKEIETRSPINEKVSPSVDLPLSTSAKRVLRNAADESQRLGHRHIGTEHLLLGIMREENSPAAQILYERGLRLDSVRQEIEAFQQTEQKEPDSDADQLQRRERLSGGFAFELQAQFNRLLDLLVSTGVIDEDEKRQITGG